MPFASVIVPARDAQETLPRALAALADQDTEHEYEVIVVDDGSSDRTASVAGQAAGPVTVISQQPAGPAAARNRGAAHASGTALAFCDADVFPTRGWLRAGLEALSTAELVQGRVLPDPRTPLGPFDRSLWITYEVGLWEAANLFLSRDLFERVGGFPAGIRPPSGKHLAEDVLFGYQAKRLGATCSFSSEALAHHAVFARDWLSYVGERRRLVYFPAIVAEVPELREALLYKRVFLSERAAKFDLALAAGCAAAWLNTPLLCLAVTPYLRVLRRHSQRTRPRGPRSLVVGAVDLVADSIGMAALVRGSFRARSPVL